MRRSFRERNAIGGRVVLFPVSSYTRLALWTSVKPVADEPASLCYNAVRMNRVAILSGCDHDRTLAPANHQYYADRQNLLYIHDTAPAPQGGMNYKLEKIAKFLRFPVAEYIFWLDDDAFFLQHDRSLETFLDSSPNRDLIICQSPINKDLNGNPIWTFLSAGNFFIRNTARARSFIDRCLEIPLDTVRQWWDPVKFGLFTNGDTDIMVYLVHTDPRFQQEDFLCRLPYEAFNTRAFHFHQRPDEHFLVHFTGTDKPALVSEFARRFRLNDALIPDDALAAMHGLRSIGR
jgi:hypothetical protein